VETEQAGQGVARPVAIAHRDGYVVDSLHFDHGDGQVGPDESPQLISTDTRVEKPE
jgi:hypothetical protein